MIESGLTEFTLALLLNHIVQGLAIVAVVALVLWRMRVNAATRHIVWSWTLAGICLLPLIAFLPPVQWDPLSFTQSRPAVETDNSVNRVVIVSRITTPNDALEPAPEPSGPPAWLGLGLLLCWFLGICTGIALFARQLNQTRLFRKQSRPCGRQINALLQQLCEQQKIRSGVDIFSHDQIEAPMTIGLFRPWIVLPLSWTRGISADVLQHTLLHELAHIQRRDTRSVLLQKMLQTLFFFHPAVWLVTRQLEVDRESACDDWAIARSRSAGDYASSLVAVAESVNLRNHAVLAVGCLRTRSQLRKRITHMLNRNSDHSTRPRLWSIALTLLSMSAVAGAAAQTWPQHESIFTQVRQDFSSLLQLSSNREPREINEEDGLLYAAWSGDLTLAQQMIDAGADPDEVHGNRTSPRTALNAAASAGHLEIVRLLVENGANVNRVVRGDAPALTAAARSGRFEVSQYLLEQGADADSRTRGDGSPLISAAASGDLKLVEMLLAAGADADAPVRGDGSPMIAAARRGNLEIIDALLKAGADPDRYVPGDEAPLYHAVSQGHYETVEALIDAGANADANYAGDGTPLMLALSRGDSEIAQLLMDNGAGVNTAVSGDGTALIEAARRGDLANARMLIRAGANVNQAVRGDGNPLINASMSGRLEMARLLVRNGAKLDVHVSGDDTPLINAVRSGNENLVRYLLDAGASANLAGDYDRELRADRTPLNQATKYQSVDIERQLRSAGAY